MLIVIEGADGSGKTTLANRIRKDLQDYCLFWRSSGPPKNMKQLTDVVGMLNDIPKRQPVVTDRNPLLSEYIYGPILRGTCMHALSIEKMAHWLKHALIIHCRPNYSALAAGVRREDQLEGVRENHRLIVQAYDSLMMGLAEYGATVKPYDYTGPPQLIMEAVTDFIREQRNG